MKRLLLIFFIVCVAAVSGRAQSFTLQGKVMDSDMNPLELATVSCVKQGKVTMTNLKGEFSMELHSADSVTVSFSMIGYKTKTRVLRNPRGKQTLQIQLFDDDYVLNEVTVTEKKRQTSTTQDIDVKDIKATPSATGNAVEELIQQQAGVSTHSEMSSQYNVRGGSFDENCVYINNVEVYRPFLVRSGQQEGLSIINPDMVESIGFSTGGFEARFGDRMASALDIKYRRPTRKVEGTISASLLGASAYLGLKGKHFTWSNGLRYKTNRYLLGSMQTKGEYDPTFLDYQTYFSYQPNKRWTIDFIGNISDNHYNFKPKDRETKFGTMENVKDFRVYFDGEERDLFRTFFGTLSITRNFTENTRISLIASAFNTKEKETYDIQGQYWLTQTETSENLGVGTYMEHARNYLKANVESFKLMLNQKTRKHAMEAGLTYRMEQITEHNREYEMRDSAGYSVPHTGNDLYLIYSLNAHNKLNANRIEAYAQDTYKFSSGAAADDDGESKQTFYTLNYGVRLAHWNFNRETIVSPRVSLGIVPSFNHDMTFRLAAGLYYQAPFYKELRDTTTIGGINTSTGGAVTTATLNNKIKSQRSIHFIAGMDYRFHINERPYRFSAEAYFKALGNLIPYSVNNVKIVYYGENSASGHAAGIDLKLYGEFVPGTDSWISLSWMNTRMKLNGRTMPLPTDQRIGVNLFFTDYFPGTERWKMSLKLAYADGLPFGPPHRELEMQSFRAPAYKRADIGMSYLAYGYQPDIPAGARKGLKVWLGLDCLNLLGINNVNSYYWITDVTNQQYAVPNYLTGRQINARVLVEF
ncbi:MAG: carboxypeptidase-like regulatory domain-containing protein [Prevotella sp.]|nr:carboxypeptidase-like regulatory domain-containing protein [Prevotella sp.]